MKDESLFVKKLILHKCLKYENGTFSIWDVPMFFFPYEAFCFTQNKFTENLGEDFNKLLYICGFIQSYNGTKVLIKKFGMKAEKKEFFDQITSQAHMTGQGSFDIISEDKEKDMFVVENSINPIAKEYLEMYKKQENCIDYYIAGLMAGGFSGIYDKNYVTIEKECIAKGDPKCIFEIHFIENITNENDSAYFKQLYKEIEHTLSKQNINTLLKRKK